MGENESSPIDTLQAVMGRIVRRKWWILATFPCVALASVLVISKLPKTYTSSATLVVAQQRIFEQYMEVGDPTSAADSIQMMKRAVMSHTRLLAIIDELGLYADDRAAQRPEVLTAVMREEIKVEPLDEISSRRGRDYAAFQISFNAATPELAQATVWKLTTLFIEEDRKTRGDQTARTVDFVKGALETAARKVAEQERRIEAAKTANAQLDRRRLTSVTMAATLASDLRLQLQSAQSTLSQIQARRVSLESTLTVNLSAMQREREALLAKFTPQHAEVLRKEQQIARLQSLMDQLRTGASGSTSAGGQDDSATAQLRTQVSSLLAETEAASKEEKRLRTELSNAQIGEVSSSVMPTGGADQGLTELMRDYDVYKKEYTDLVIKQQQALGVAAFDGRQDPTQFRLIDPPTFPLKPASPKVLLLNLAGAGAGLLLGLILAIFADLQAGGIHSERELAAIAQVPLILSIPVIRTDAEQRRRTIRRIVSLTAAAVVVVAVAALEYYAYSKG